MALSPGTRFGPYEILSPLGEGGMGEVYRGRDANLGRDVALKVLPVSLANDAEYIARFQREAHVLASLNHPNIAAIYGLEGPAIVMELVEGPTLADRIAQGPIPLEEALLIARQIVEALEYAHERNIIHRDLKPANVKITPDGVVKVLDFGLAKIADSPAQQSNPATSPTLTVRAATQAGLILGTAAYMAPEQARAQSVDRRADIWALGAVLFEMLSGKMAFPGDNVTDILASVVKIEPDWSALPASTLPIIRKLIQRCMTKDRKRRLQAIGEARLMMEDDLLHPAVDAAPQRRAGRPWALLIYAAVLTAILIAIVVLRAFENPAAERVLRYSIALPERAQVHTFAISPDGSYLAISAATEGKRRLYLRPLDALTVQDLKDTEDATYPFWSPDSRWIGFFAEGKLKRVGVNGSPPQVLCDARQGRGGTWNRDGVIVFAPSNDGALMRVSAAGGLPIAVTNPAKGEVHRFPTFLPDGKRFLYVSILGPEGTGGIALTSLDRQVVQRVIPDESSAVWHGSGETGYLLFIRNGTLLAQPMNAKSFKPAGELFPVAQAVAFANRNYVNATLSANGLLVYSSGNLGAEQQLLWYDRSGKELSKVGKPSRIRGLSLSPDEKMLAVVRGGLDSDIWIHDFSRQTETRFTFDASGSRSPVWSRDGRRIAYASTQRGYSNLYVKETAGTDEAKPLLSQKGPLRSATDWSRDGRILLYTEVYRGNHLRALNMDGVDVSPIFPDRSFVEEDGHFSPDGKWIAYTSEESGRREIYVRPFPPGPGKWKISTDGGELPRWRADGKEIFFSSLNGVLMASTVTIGNENAVSADVPNTLFDAGIRNAIQLIHPYAVSADGKRFLVARPTGDTADPPLTVVVNWLAAAKK